MRTNARRWRRPPPRGAFSRWRLCNICREGKGPKRALLSKEMPLIIGEATKGGGPKFFLTVLFPGVWGGVYRGRAPRVIPWRGGRVGLLRVILLTVK